MASSELCIIGGNAHPELTAKIADHLHTEPLNANIGRFADGEISVEIVDNVRDKDVFLIQPTGPPANDNIMEALFIIDALRRSSAGRITAVMPYFGYARQDRKETSRTPISAKVVANIFSGDADTGVDRFLSMDLHADQIQGFTDLPFDHLKARYILADYLKKMIENPLPYSPDAGGLKRTSSTAHLLGEEYGFIEKTRIDDKRTTVGKMVGPDVTGRNVLLVDDQAATCGTLLSSAKAVKQNGAAKVYAAVTHGIFCGDAIERIINSKDLDQIFYTNTLPKKTDHEKFHEVDISESLANAIDKINKGKSLQNFFKPVKPKTRREQAVKRAKKIIAKI
jgi:ribose-phosphate pyrophosphokinase